MPSHLVVPFNPIALELGPFSIRWYGIFLAAAIFLGSSLWLSEALRRGVPLPAAVDLLTWTLPGGLIAARAFHVADNWSFYLTEPSQVVSLTAGGLAIWGALAGGGVVALWRARRLRLPIRPIADAAALALPPAQALGSLGLFLNGEHIGLPTSLPWGVIFTNPNTLAPDFIVARHPVAAYEGLFSLALSASLWVLRDRLPRAGQLFLFYLVLYSAGSFAFASLRLDNPFLFGWKTAQIASTAAAAGVVVILALRAVGRALGASTRGELDRQSAKDAKI